MNVRLPVPVRFRCPWCNRFTIRPHMHHVLPREWGGPDVPGNRVRLCAACHNDVHALLDWYEVRGHKPPWREHMLWRRKVRALAAEGWKRRLEGYTG